MFSPHLFDHKYDIDQLLIAFCNATTITPPPARWFLNTRTGDITPETIENKQQFAELADGADTNHWHIINPLPISYLAEIRSHSSLARHTPQTQAEIAELISNIKNLNQAPALFDHGAAGGWLRERLKDAILEWLDFKQLIPPSMRHTRPQQLSAATKKVNII